MGVPSKSLIWLASNALSKARETPKSDTFTWSFLSSSRFSGLMSRWAMRCWCRYDTPCTMSTMRLRTRSMGRPFPPSVKPSSSSLRSSPFSRYSKMRYSLSSFGSSITSYSRTTFGCCIFFRRASSRHTLSMADTPPLALVLTRILFFITFIALTSSLSLSTASFTLLKLPLPKSAITEYWLMVLFPSSSSPLFFRFVSFTVLSKSVARNDPTVSLKAGMVRSERVRYTGRCHSSEGSLNDTPRFTIGDPLVTSVLPLPFTSSLSSASPKESVDPTRSVSPPFFRSTFRLSTRRMALISYSEPSLEHLESLENLESAEGSLAPSAAMIESSTAHKSGASVIIGPASFINTAQAMRKLRPGRGEGFQWVSISPLHAPTPSFPPLPSLPPLPMKY
eukprot:Sspe_Gene.11840::Locus_4020_Transcript_1_1_Confidence_1.000_Length_2345::g.11840::m.11840